MEHKTMLIGGGVAVVAVIAFIAVKNGRQSATSDQASPDTASTGYFAGMSPISGGISSGGIASSSMPVDPSNSGSSDTGGGFDLGALFSSLFSSQAATSSLQIRSGANVAESSILAGIDYGMFGGNASVNHTDTGTTFTLNKGGDPYDNIISNAYQSILGRAPDLGGLAYYKDQLANNGLSASAFSNELLRSPEYAMSHAAPITVSTFAPVSTPVTTSTASDPVTQSQQLTLVSVSPTVSYSAPITPQVTSVSRLPSYKQDQLAASYE